MPGCCPHNKMPGLTDMAKDLTNTLVNAIRQGIRTGEVLTDGVTVKERVQICEKCPEKMGTRCLKCGCYISLKAAVKAAKCPLGKW